MALKITNENINDLMVCALEGGINYWCGRVKITKLPKDCGEDIIASDVISRGGELTLYDAESDDKWILRKENFLKGIEKTMVWGDFKSIEDLIDNHDAETADVLLQYALFDDIVFG